MQFVQTISLDNSVWVFLCHPCERGMSCELYEGKALSIVPLQGPGEPKNSLSAGKLKV